jgi:hypothetical protein
MKEMFRRLTRSITDCFAECAYAQRRIAQLRTSPDFYRLNPDAAPEDYAEFLFRTSGWLQHEPSASERARAKSRR